VRRLKILLATLAVCLCLVPAGQALAAEKNVFDQVPCDAATGTSAACNAGGDPITGSGGAIAKVTTLIAYIAGIAAIITIIVGGVMYVLSQGDSGKIKAARDTVLYAVIGLVVIILARTIIIFVIGKVK
jgi:hypothetical protein